MDRSAKRPRPRNPRARARCRATELSVHLSTSEGRSESRPVVRVLRAGIPRHVDECAHEFRRLLEVAGGRWHVSFRSSTRAPSPTKHPANLSDLPEIFGQEDTGRCLVTEQTCKKRRVWRYAVTDRGPMGATMPRVIGVCTTGVTHPVTHRITNLRHVSNIPIGP